MTKEASPKSPGLRKQQKAPQENAKDSGKKQGETSDQARDEISTESEMETSKMDEQNTDAHIPTKIEMTVFSGLKML